MRSMSEFRAGPETTENESDVSYRKVALWAIVGVAIVAGVVAYFKYAKLLAPLLG